MKKIPKVMVLVLTMLFIVPSLCLAQAGGWCTATVTSFGVGGPTTSYIALTDTNHDPAFTPGTYFTADTTGVHTDEMLATASSAISRGRTVLVYLDSFAPMGNISAFYLNK